MSHSVTELFASLKNGDQTQAKELCERLYQMYAKAAYREMERLGRNDASDLVQDGFFTFWKELVAGKISANNRAHLCGIVKRIILDRLFDVRRKEQRRNEKFAISLESELRSEKHSTGVLSALGTTDVDDFKVLFDDLLSVVSDNDRTVLLLELQECKLRELVELTGLTEWEIRKRQRRARASILASDWLPCLYEIMPTAGCED